MEEIANQIKTYEAYAKKIKRKDLVETYEKISRIIHEIRKKKGGSEIKDTGVRDSVFYALEDNLSVFHRK